MAYVNVGKENSGDIDLFYNDWGSGQPVVFSHGWPLSADAFEDQMFFLDRPHRGIGDPFVKDRQERNPQGLQRRAPRHVHDPEG